uniref:RING-type domain-containing protein n=1 Tax=Xenopus tropicalis TaxID=8364 RepID=A0A1B8XUH5_XENTR
MASCSTEFNCSICLSIYTNPVTLYWSHTFCQGCITKTWVNQLNCSICLSSTAAISSARAVSPKPESTTCPRCRNRFNERPELKENSELCNKVQLFLSVQQDKDKISCTYCVYLSVPAYKTCPHCEASLSDVHLAAPSKSEEHVLSEPTSSPEKEKCSVHKKMLEFSCIKDGALICVSGCLVGGWGTQGPQSGDAEGIRERRDLSEISSQDEKLSLHLSELINRLEIKKDELSNQIRHTEELCNMADPLAVTLCYSYWSQIGCLLCYSGAVIGGRICQTFVVNFRISPLVDFFARTYCCTSNVLSNVERIVAHRTYCRTYCCTSNVLSNVLSHIERIVERIVAHRTYCRMSNVLSHIERIVERIVAHRTYCRMSNVLSHIERIVERIVAHRTYCRTYCRTLNVLSNVLLHIERIVECRTYCHTSNVLSHIERIVERIVTRRTYCLSDRTYCRK